MKKKFYNDEFSEVMVYCRKENLFLGEGTPNADILIIGKECGLNSEKRKDLKVVEDKGNKEQIKEWILENSQEEAKSNLKRLDNEAVQEQNVVFAKSNLMKLSYEQNQYNDALRYAEAVLKMPKTGLVKSVAS